ncbi:MAG: lytic murein transglycosylase [Syntrophotalea acetylenica]|jgi:membrane-bound lytic murein transglycosylase B|uniref:lytic murein transglycosylase n=1 Tax=Syntrophotalea TaxID=2812025 RepID=UPI002A360B30|nr:lytic murein transglycosylase [Syntrophotalea acetylenica]MDD4456413.1 lytic murein transglycosylase [Syntrophotalea acetylenica]MDY0261440.1 lytic murein transglycosylase [Syntrophotalea acetylenica]
MPFDCRSLFLATVLLGLCSACTPKPQAPPPLPGSAPDPGQPAAALDDQDLQWRTWLEDLGEEALAQGIREEVLHDALADLQPAPELLMPRHKQAEFALSKQEYVQRLASEQRFQAGLQRKDELRDLLQKIEWRYGVPEAYLLALWAIESDFGKGANRHPVIRALATQAWRSQRPAFFRKQLLAALQILDQERMPSEQLRGSWAGAMGHFQFIPTTYLDYAVDFNDDGKRDIWTDVEDALASAASYLARAGWQRQTAWGWRIDLPAAFDRTLADPGVKKSLADWRALGLPAVAGSDEVQAALLLPDGPQGPAFLVTDNLRVLMRWNRSVAFALAVGHLADRFEKADRNIPVEGPASPL